MTHSVTNPLSRQEEDTLRLIAHGISSTRHLIPDDLDQLAKLRLVDGLGGKVTLSEFGQVRLTQSQEEQFLSIIRAARDISLTCASSRPLPAPPARPGTASADLPN